MYLCNVVMLCMHVYSLYGIMLHIHGYATHDTMHECDIMDDSSMDDIFFRRIWLSFFKRALQKMSFEGMVLELLMKMGFGPFEILGKVELFDYEYWTLSLFEMLGEVGLFVGC